MSNLSRDRGTMAGYEDPRGLGLDRYDPCEIDPPERVFVRLGVLLMIALAFGLGAELLVRLPPH